MERVRLTFTVDGAEIEIVHTERAVALALAKYCSVAATLAPAVVVETNVVVNGRVGDVVTHPGAEWATPVESQSNS